MIALQKSRLADGSPGTRIKTAVVTTERAVEIYSRESRSIVREVLLISGMTVPRSVPLLVDHVRSVRTTAGTATNFRVVGDTVEADLHFANGTSAADEAWELVRQDHVDSVSIGYRVIEARSVPAGRTETINGKTYTGPLRVATRWTLYEVSVVPIGADSAAKIRSDQLAGNSISVRSKAQGNQTMKTSVPQQDTGHLRIIDFCRAFTAGHGGRVDGSDADMLRSFASIGGLDDLDSRFQVALVAGYNAAADSTAGWIGVQPLPNYLQSELAIVTTPAAPQRIGRGGTAPATLLAMQFEQWRLFKIGIQFELDEADIIDTSTTIDAWALATKEIGAAFRRTVLDAIWGCVLANPDLGDNVALFASDRGNLGTAAFSSTALDLAMTGIGSQVRAITSDSTAFAHDNLQASHLVVPPELYLPALTAVRDMSVDSPVLTVRSESRLSTNGFLDPRDNVVRSGTGTGWMLACSAAQAPAVVLGTLNGKREPRTAGYDLDAGQWGRGFQADLSLGVCAVDGRPAYWSTGTA